MENIKVKKASLCQKHNYIRYQTINLQVQTDSLNQNEWNSLLGNYNDYNIFQSYEWGQLKMNSGWLPLRVHLLDNNKSKLMTQILIKNILGKKIGWCPGGPLINSDTSQEAKFILEKFHDYVLSKRIINLRCKSFSIKDESNEFIFASFPKSSNNITSSRSIIHKITDTDNFLKNVRKKHRYSIKQSEKNELDWIPMDDSKGIDHFLKIYREMSLSKNLKLPIIDLIKFRELNNSKFKLISFCGLKNNICYSSCIVSLFNKKAFYHYSATSNEGRKISAAYGMIFNLVKYLHSVQIEELDFGGLSEDGSSAGVDFFKEGFNGDIINRVGEFDISKSNFYRVIFNKAIKFKNFN